MFGLFGKSKHQEVSAPELNAMLADGKALVVDVREVDEFAAGHIPGAINMPLSTFQASKLPDSGGKTIILSCAAGGRSAQALNKCAQAQAAVDTHLAGGFGAWRAAGLPIAR